MIHQKFINLAYLMVFLPNVASSALPGKLDITFSNDGIATPLFPSSSTDDMESSHNAMTLQADDKILMVGNSRRAGQTDSVLVRYLANGTLDHSFGVQGRSIMDFGKGADDVASCVQMSGSKIVVAGRALNAQGHKCVYVARFQTDGTLDTSFGSGGVTIAPIYPSIPPQTLHYLTVSGLTLQSDGAILLCGNTGLQTNANFMLARFTAKGALDTTFGQGGVASTDIDISMDSAESVLVQADGKIIAVGYANIREENNYFRCCIAIVRYTAKGVLDTTFQTKGKRIIALGNYGSSEANAIVPLPGGKFGVAGSAVYLRYYAQFNADGSGDASYQPAGRFPAGFATQLDPEFRINRRGESLVVKDGVAHVGGSQSVPTSDIISPAWFSVTSFEKVDGQMVVREAHANPGELDKALSLRIQSTGRLVLAGRTGIYTDKHLEPTDFAMAGFLPGGGVDTTFGENGLVVTDMQHSYARTELKAGDLQPDGKVISAGQLLEDDIPHQGVLFRHLSNGELDPAFGIGGRVLTRLSDEPCAITAVKVQPDGRIVASFSMGTSLSADFGLARYLPDGSLDTSFSGTGKVRTSISEVCDTAYALALLPDGKIMVVGSSGDVAAGGSGRVVLARYLADGTLDTTFHSRGWVTEEVSHAVAGVSVALTADGGLALVAQQDSHWTVLRFTAEGELDASFGGGDGKLEKFGNGSVVALAVQPDGRIVLAGTSLNALGFAEWTLRRLLPDGALDPGFDSDGQVTIPLNLSAYNQATCVTIQENDRILVGGGQAVDINSGPQFSLVRLLRTGKLDTSFGSGGKVVQPAFPRSFSKATAVIGQPDGRIITIGYASVDFLPHPVVMRFEGVAGEPELFLEYPPGTPVTPASGPFDFGSLRAGETSSMTFTIRNRGDGVLVPKAPYTTPDFSVDMSSTHMSLQPGASTTFKVTFSPRAAGQSRTDILMDSNDIFGNSGILRVSGSGIATEIITQPRPVLGVLGQPARLTFEVSSVAVLKRSWQRLTGDNWHALKTGVEGQHSIASMKISDVGRYRGTIEDLMGTYVSDDVTVGCVTPAPAVVVLKPEGRLVLNVVAAAPADASFAYRWHRNEEPLANDGTRVSGVTDRSLIISGVTSVDAGRYSCHVTMFTAQGNVDVMAPGTVVHVSPAPEIPAFDLPELRVGQSLPPLDIPVVGFSSRFTAIGLPPGITLNPTTGQLYGKPTKAKLKNGLEVPYLVKFSAASPVGTGAVREVSWMVRKLPDGALGTFYGLLERKSPLNGGMGGTIKLTIASMGSFSGTLKLAAVSLPFTGRLETPAVTGHPLATFTIARRSPLMSITGSFCVDVASGQLTQTVLDDGVSGPVAFTARRAHWNSLNKASAFAFSHTAALQPPAIESDDDLITCPQGTGFVTLNVSTGGAVTWGGRLADGTAVTGSTPLSEHGHAALHHMLYANTGSVQGWVQIVEISVDGTMNWFKARQADKAVTRTYKAGISLHDLVVVGSRYLKPSSGQIILGLPLKPVPEPNATLTFAGLGMETSFEQPFNLSRNHVAKVSETPEAVKLTVAPRSGLFSGSFKLGSGRTVRSASFYGVVVTRLGSGVGFFNLPEAAVPPQTPANAPMWSGKVTLDDY